MEAIELGIDTLPDFIEDHIKDSSGKLAFDGLRSKGEIYQDMFTTIRDFSEDVSQVCPKRYRPSRLELPWER